MPIRDLDPDNDYAYDPTNQSGDDAPEEPLILPRASCATGSITPLQFALLREVDGLPKHRIEFEETCALRTLRRQGIVVRYDDQHGVMRVDWSTVPLVRKPTRS